jgi:carboxypeptidase Taq
VDTRLQAARDELLARLREMTDLRYATAVLNWDQTTYMPPGGATARSRQIALLERLAHERATDPALGKLLDQLQPHAESLPYDSDDAALIRVARRDFTRATRLPNRFVAEAAEHMALSYQVWTTARPADDFAAVQPLLEKTLDLSRRYADFFPGYTHVADPLIDRADEGMTVATIRPLFAELRDFLAALIRRIGERPAVDAAFLYSHYLEAQQREIGETIIRAYGYDFNRGRQDKTHHPYMTRFSWGDIRITTRFMEDYLPSGLFSTLHESGHAMYEMGTQPEHDGTPLGDGASAGVHESQSRMWENVVGRSRGLWEHYYPMLQAAFPTQLRDVSPEGFYRAINRVEPSLIRVEADEVTYNLHIIIRFELENDLLDGRLAVEDLPEVWRSRYYELLGVASEDDRDGVLQDVHWYSGPIGGVFQGYALGNIIAGAFYAAALKAEPSIPDEISHGRFDLLHGWLRENIYRHGRKFTPDELIRRVTGGPLTLEPYKAYLLEKYGAIYGL